MTYTLKRLRYLIDTAVEVPCISEWMKGSEKKHHAFAIEGKIYDWLEKNVPNWSEKGCNYIDILTLFIKKEVLG